MTDDIGLEGKVAIVTGAGAGLGRSHALELAGHGCRLVLGDLPGKTADVAEEVRGLGGSAVVVEGDIAGWDIGEHLVKTALAAYGALDVLVNNAGVTRDRMVFTMTEAEWDTVLAVHLKGHFVTTRHATAYWRELAKSTGEPVNAAIVNTASEAFLLAAPGQPNYAAAKAGIAALTTVTAASCGRYGVRANAICPRARTAMTANVFGPPPADGSDPLSAGHVSPLVAYLASATSRHITGQVFIVYGGIVAVMAPPAVSRSVRGPQSRPRSAAELADALGPMFSDDPKDPGFVTDLSAL